MRWLYALDRRTLTGLGVVLAIVLFVALNTWGALTLRRHDLDLTENRQFTLSESTRELLAEMKEPITLRLYVSKAVRDGNPYLATYAARVHDTLKAYAAAANGKITLDYIDPEPFSPEEDRAVGFGLEPVTLDAAGTSGYLGIAGTNATDDVDVLPVLSPDRERFLEYDLTRMVYNLANPEKPVVAMISGLPLNGDPALQHRPWQIWEQLSQLYDIRWMGGEIASFDPDVKLVVLVHPQNLPDKTLWAVDQLVLRGGKAMVFVDPHSEAAAMRTRTPMPAAAPSGLDKLLNAWGVEQVPGKVVADPRFARQVQYPSGGRPQVVDYLPWLSLDRDALSQSDLVTSELQRLNLASAGLLKARQGATTEFLPLVRSSEAAQAIDVDRVAMFPDPIAIRRGYKPEGERLTIAARVTGPARSAFADALPTGVEAGADRRLDSDGPISVVVVADTDLLDDRTWIASQNMLGQTVAIPVADNAGFVANALDFLAGSEALAGLRGREVTFRPFTKVAEIRRAAEEAYRAKEQELVQKLQDLQKKLAALEVGKGEEGALVSARQRDEIEGFRTQILETRQELREVQHALRKDIEELRDTVRFANIAAVPILVAVLAIVMAVVKRVRFRRRFDAAAA